MITNPSRTRYALALSIVIAASLASCGPNIQPPTYDEVMEWYDMGSAEVGGTKPIDRVEVYIDASVPMRNFVKERYGETKSLYTRLLEFMGSNPWNVSTVRYFGFGEADPVPIQSERGLTVPANERAFYDQKWTHIGELIGAFRQRLAKGDRAVKIVITDLVQSNQPCEQEPSQTNWAYLANQIRECQRLGGWQLLALRSEYQGTHYPEGGGKPFLVSSQVDRPFYIMIFGRDEKAAEQGARGLLEGVGTGEWSGKAKRFRPRAQMGRVSWLSCDIPAETGAPAQGNRVYPALDELYEGRVLAVEWKNPEDRRGRAGLRLRMRIESVAESAAPQESFIDVRNPALKLQMTCFHWSGSNAKKSAALTDTLPVVVESFGVAKPTFSTTPSAYGAEHWIDCTLKPPAGMQSKQCYIFRGAIYADVDRLRLPEWVEKWSTDDDGAPGSITSTLNLKRVLGNIVRNTGIDYPLFTAFVLVHGVNPLLGRAK